MTTSAGSSTSSSVPRRGANNDWSDNVVDVLERIRDNSIRLAEHHRRRYYHFKGFSKYFDVPVLVLSIFGSSFAVGTQHYLNQRVISATSCLIGVIVSIITSIKLYLSIETTMQSEFKMSKNFYTLSIDIHHILLLSYKERGENGLAYMQKMFGTYSKLMEESNLFQRQFENDRLACTPSPDLKIVLPQSPLRRSNPPPPPPVYSMPLKKESSVDFSEDHKEIAKNTIFNWRRFAREKQAARLIELPVRDVLEEDDILSVTGSSGEDAPEPLEIVEHSNILEDTKEDEV